MKIDDTPIDRELEEEPKEPDPGGEGIGGAKDGDEQLGSKRKRRTIGPQPIRRNLLVWPHGPYNEDMSNLPGVKEIVLNTSRTLAAWEIGHGLGMIPVDGRPYIPAPGADYEPDRTSDPAFPDEVDECHMWDGRPNAFLANIHLRGSMYIETGPRLIFSFTRPSKDDKVSEDPNLADFSLRDFRFVVDYFRNHPKNPRIGEGARTSHTDTGLPALQIMDLNHEMTRRLGITEEFHEIMAPSNSRWDAGTSYCLIPHFLGLPWLFRPGPLTARSMALGKLGSQTDDAAVFKDAGPCEGSWRSTLIPLTYFISPVFNADPDKPTHWVITRHSRHESCIFYHASHEKRIHQVHVEALIEYFYRTVVRPQFPAYASKESPEMPICKHDFQKFYHEYLDEKEIDPDSVPDPWEDEDDDCTLVGDDDDDEIGEAAENGTTDKNTPHYHHHDLLRHEIDRRDHTLLFKQDTNVGSPPGIGTFAVSTWVDHPGDAYGDLDLRTWGPLQSDPAGRMTQAELDWLLHFDRDADAEARAEHAKKRAEAIARRREEDDRRRRAGEPRMVVFEDPLDRRENGAIKGKFFHGSIKNFEEGSSGGDTSDDDSIEQHREAEGNV
jgi:hypothetical protein